MATKKTTTKKTTTAAAPRKRKKDKKRKAIGDLKLPKSPKVFRHGLKRTRQFLEQLEKLF